MYQRLLQTHKRKSGPQEIPVLTKSWDLQGF